MKRDFIDAIFRRGVPYLIIFGLALPVASQSFLTRVYTIDDGLPSSEVYGVAQDDKGRMWFTTRGGLVVYDGLSWTIADRVIVRPGMAMTKVRSGHRGLMWVSDPSDDILITGYSALRNLGTSPIEKRNWPLPSELAETGGFKVSAFAVTSRAGRAHLAVGLRKGGLWLWQGDQWLHLGTGDGLPEGPVQSIAGWNGSFFVAMTDAVCAVNGANIDCSIGRDLPSDIGILFAVAVRGRDEHSRVDGSAEPDLWLLAQRALMQRRSDGFEIVEDRFELDIDERFPTSLLPTGNGVFFGQVYRLFHFEPRYRSIEVLGRENGLAADGVTDLFLDREDNVWATTMRGVSKIVSQRFTNYDERIGLLEDEVSAICERANGDIVFGHNAGLTIFDGSRFKLIEFDGEGPFQAMPPRVMDLCTDSRGRTWVAGSRLGLGRLTDDDRVEWVRGPVVAQGDSVYSIAETEDGNLMVGSSYGLGVMKDGGDLVSFAEPKELQTIRRIHKLRDGTMLAVTSADGLLMIRNQRLEVIPGPDQKLMNNMYSVFEDSKGRIWIGTAGGLLQLDGGQLVSPLHDALRIDKPVYLIIEDGDGSLWFGTDDGVLSWNGNEPVSYSVQDGLAGRETNRGAGLLDSRGRLWIGTDGGASIFRPDVVHERRPAALVDIIAVETGDGRQITSGGAQLEHNDNTLIFHYSGISFVDETRLRFRCRLLGFDEHWSDNIPAHQRSIRYTNLPPGTYRFSVQACNAFGRWSEPVTSDEVVIKQPYWKNVWFAALVFSCIVLIVFTAARVVARWRYASKLEKEMNRRRIAEAENRVILEELNESRLNFASIVEENVNGIIVIDSGGTMRFVNPAASSFLGISRFHLDGPPFEVPAKGLTSAEIPITRRDGSAGRAAVIVEPMAWQGADAQMVVLRDVTEQRQAEEQLQQAQKLDAIGKLAGGVAHDFNNLLQAILSSVQFLRFNAGDAELQHKMLSDLEKDVRQGASLTKRLLQFSRQDEPHMEVLDLNEIVRQSSSLLRRLIREDIEFMVDLDREALTIKADQGQLNQVLTNLVVNACDSMDAGGRLSLRSGRHGDTEVWFEVSDTGKGIPAEIRTKIFEPFFTTKDRERGIGLGLSVVHGIVTHHGGRVEAESRVGQGACFRVFLPFSEGEAVPLSSESRDLKIQGKGEFILLVEDDDVIRRNLGEILNQLGYRVMGVASAEQAMQFPDEPVVDVLLTDLVLPGQRGDALALSLRKRWPELTVVIMSGYADDETVQTLLQVEAATFLHKPFEIGRLTQVLHDALDPASSGSMIIVKEAPRKDAPASKKILVVEDDVDISDVLVMFLKQQGHEVRVVRDGGKALQILGERDEIIDLVISDANLPVMPGEQLLKRSREMGLDVPFLLCSGDPDAEISGERIAFLHKPFDFEALTQTIESLLSEA